MAVVGPPGSGKSTVAKRAAEILGVRFIELDALFWTRPDWQPPPVDEFRASVDRATRNGGWVTAGNYSKTRDIVWGRADTVIWLDLPLRIALWRVFRRTLHGVRSRELLWGGNRERGWTALLGADSLFLYTVTTFRRRRRSFTRLLASDEYATKTFVRLRDKRSIDRWLARLPREDGGGCPPDRSSESKR